MEMMLGSVYTLILLGGPVVFAMMLWDRQAHVVPVAKSITPSPRTTAPQRPARKLVMRDVEAYAASTQVAAFAAPTMRRPSTLSPASRHVGLAIR